MEACIVKLQNEFQSNSKVFQRVQADVETDVDFLHEYVSKAFAFHTARQAACMPNFRKLDAERARNILLGIRLQLAST